MNLKLPAQFYDDKTNIGKVYSIAKKRYFLVKGDIKRLLDGSKGRNTVQRPYTLQNICDILELPVPIALRSSRYLPLPRISCRIEYCKKNYAYFVKNADDEEIECAQAIERGAAVLFVTKQHCDAAGRPYPCVIIDNGLEAFIKLCSKLRSQIGCKVVALTGSVGKTTTKDMIESVIACSFKTAKSKNNSNGFAAIALNMQKIGDGTQVYIQEAGAAFPGLVLRDARILQPDCTVITNVGYPHIDLYGSVENILDDKLNLVRYMQPNGAAVLNIDDERLRGVCLDGKRIISYAIENEDADYRARDIAFGEGSISFEIVYKGGRAPVTIFTYGVHNVYNATAAFAVGKFFGIKDENIIKALSLYKGDNTRQNLCEVGGYRLFVDCYNSAPNSIVGSVEALERINVEPGKKRIAVMGDIVRLGSLSEKVHREAGCEIAKHKLDLLIGYGKDIGFTCEEAKKLGMNTLHTEDRDQLNGWIRQYIERGDVVLFKAGHPTYMAKSIDMAFGTSFHLSDGDVTKWGRDIETERWLFHEIDAMAELRKLTQMTEHAIIPAEAEGLPVVRIGKSAFSKRTALRSVEIPDTVFNIGFSAFFECKRLERVKMSMGLKLIERSAFNSCFALKEIELPQGVIDVGERAFYKCKALKRVYIPESVHSIGNMAFFGCEALYIECPAGSFAEKWAVKNAIKYSIV